MQINSISNNQCNFNSTYPVQHWVAEVNGSYAPVSNLKLVKKMQGKLIRILNKPLGESKDQMKELDQRFRAYVGKCDVDYRNVPKVRSFYNRKEGGVKYSVSYMISGTDVDFFENRLAKDIGRAKKVLKTDFSELSSADKEKALERYNQEGLDFVNDGRRTLKDFLKVPYVLVTKFEIIRNKLGKIKDYRFVEARFLPPKGKDSQMGIM